VSTETHHRRGHLAPCEGEAQHPHLDGAPTRREPVTFTVEASRSVPFPLAHVWAVLDGFSDVGEWSSSVHRSWPEGDGPATGIGAERGCELVPGRVVHERIVDYEPEASMRIEVHRSVGLPIASMISVYEVEAEGPTSTRVSGHASLELKLPPVLLKALQTRLDAKLSERIEQAFADLEEEVKRRGKGSTSSAP